MRSLAVIVTAGLSLISMPILIRYLGDHDYSMLSLVMSIIGLCTLIDLGFNRAFSQALATSYGKEDKDALNEVMSVGTVMNLVLVVVFMTIVTFISITSSWWVSDITNKSLFATVLLITGVTNAIRLPTRMAGEMLRNLLRNDLLALGCIVETIIRIGLSILAVIHGYGLITVATISLVTVTLENIWEFLCVKRIYPDIQFTTIHFTMDCTKRLFRYSTATFFSDSLDKMKVQIIPLIIVNLISLNALVFMVIANRLIDYCSLFIQSWSAMLTPVFGQIHGNSNHQQLESVLSKGSSLLTLGAAYISLCLYTYSGVFIETWLGPNYAQSSDIIKVLAIGLCVGSVMSLSKECLFGIGKIHGLIVIHLLEIVLTVALCIPLGMKYGLLGIAWANVLGTVPIEIIGVTYLVSTTLSCSWIKIYGESLLVLLKFSVVAIIAYMVIHAQLQPKVTSLILFNLIQVVCFIPVIWLLLPQSIQSKCREMLL